MGMGIITMLVRILSLKLKDLGARARVRGDSLSFYFVVLDADAERWTDTDC